MPPSIAPADPDVGKVQEPVVWHRDGEPAKVDMSELRRAVHRVAAAALLARHWPTGRRHAAALAVAGGLLRAGWPVGDIEVFLTAVCAAANDSEVNDRVRAASDTAANLEAGEKATGWPVLVALLGPHGDAVVSQIHHWLGVTMVKAKAGNPGPLPGPIRYRPLPEFKPFPTHCLPELWAGYVRQGAAALRCDETLVALPLFAVLASAIGNSRRVQLGAEWCESAVLWTCAIAESCSLKSPAADITLDLVKARQRRLVAEFRRAAQHYRLALAEYKRAARDGDDAGDPPEKPTLKRVMVGDITIEKLAGLLDDNRRGLLAHRDELAGWLGNFAKYKGKAGGSDEPNWLSMHRADMLVYDRKTGDKTTVIVPHAAVSVCDGIQPGVLARLMGPQFLESGLTARILFAMPPRTPKQWSDRTIDVELKAAAARNLDAVFDLAPDTDADGAPGRSSSACPPEARQRMATFVNAWGVRQFRAEGDEAAALAKPEALPGRIRPPPRMYPS